MELIFIDVLLILVGLVLIKIEIDMKINRVGYLLVIIGTILVVSRYVFVRKELVDENNKIIYTLQQQMGYSLGDNIDVYDGILSIPQIKLKKGVYDIYDKRNNIEENVTIHELSDYPSKDNSNLILIAYSGSDKKSFFNDIGKLNNDSLIEFYYQRVKYVYKISDYYNIDVDDYSKIKRDITKKTITLITCNREDKTKQLVYIGYLIDEVKY